MQPYNGAPELAEACVDSIRLLAELTTPAQMETAVKFVRTRLSEKARLVAAELNTLNLIADAINQHCTTRETPESVIATLNALRIKGEMTKFLESVEKLTAQLSNSYNKTGIPTEVATRMATQMGVKTLINAIPDNDLKLILRARDFDCIKAAIQKINENTPAPQSAQIFAASRSTHRGRQNYNNNHNITQQGNRYNFSNRNGNRNPPSGQGYNISGQHNANYRFHQNNRNNNNYQRGRQNYRGRGHYQHRVFYTEGPLTQMQTENQHNVEQNNHATNHPFGVGQGQSTQLT